MAQYPNGVNFRFKRPQRPEADRVVFELMRAMRGHKTSDIWKRTFLCQSTISKIRTRRTRYPTHLTCSAIAAAIGMKWELVPATSVQREPASPARSPRKAMELTT